MDGILKFLCQVQAPALLRPEVEDSPPAVLARSSSVLCPMASPIEPYVESRLDSLAVVQV